MKECINCKWKGEDEEVTDGGLAHCPNCGDNTRDIVEEPKEEESKPKRKSKKEDNFDLNRDGKVDKKDTRLAARVLRRARK